MSIPRLSPSLGPLAFGPAVMNVQVNVHQVDSTPFHNVDLCHFGTVHVDAGDTDSDDDSMPGFMPANWMHRQCHQRSHRKVKKSARRTVPKKAPVIEALPRRWPNPETRFTTIHYPPARIVQ
ncbi:hypothetical protein DFH06DRAFT_1329149 [Mycena polygramma]|nr:hypothetical protein DFH06DRAFT_1329149 [Mycena polygramma]